MGLPYNLSAEDVYMSIYMRFMRLVNRYGYKEFHCLKKIC